MLELKKITKDYPAGDGTVHALQGIDLKFRKSEFVSILGPSGCGKTTLLNIVGGLDHYSDGDLVINGRSLESLGATLDDLAEIMLAHGAVNASNLDGGSSSIMIMNDEYLTSSAYIFGERVVATAILVK